MKHRIGFCCKYMHPDRMRHKKILEAFELPLNQRMVSLSWANRQNPAVAERRIMEVAEHNIRAAELLINYVSSLPPQQHMVRIGSGVIPLATEPTWRKVFQDSVNRNHWSQMLRRVGDRARAADVRLSFHPGQFCALASDRTDVVDRSVDEFEYHVDIAQWMGYGTSWQDFKINVHIGGRQGHQGILKVLSQLSDGARNMITIENDEMQWGLDETLKLAQHLPLVLDIHHHWVRDHEYIQASDDRVKRVLDSWRGRRPVLHYSYSRDEYLAAVGHSNLPNMNTLLAMNQKRSHLRAHSDTYPNHEANNWALSFWPWFDIQCEAKWKNIASSLLHQHAVNHKLLETSVCV